MNEQPKVHEKYTQERKVKNDASLGSAEHHTELWDEAEIAILVGCWNDVPLEEIAEALGRTIEACRQKFYTLGQAKVTQAKKIKKQASTKIDVWTKGFTSIDDMDAYYENLGK